MNTLKGYWNLGNKNACILRQAFLVIILINFSGCSLFSLKAAVPEQLILLPPSEGPSKVLLKQKVTMITQAEQHQLIVVIRLEQEQLKLRALLPTGQAVLSIDYDGHELIENNYSSVALPSEEILAMMQFSLWPVDSIVKYYLPKHGWQFKVTPLQRTLQTVEGRMLSVDYLSLDELLVTNHMHDFQVKILTLEKVAL